MRPGLEARSDALSFEEPRGPGPETDERDGARRVEGEFQGDGPVFFLLYLGIFRYTIKHTIVAFMVYLGFRDF